MKKTYPFILLPGEIPLVGETVVLGDGDSSYTEDRLEMRHMVIHRNNPADQRTGVTAVLSASSASVSNV